MLVPLLGTIIELEVEMPEKQRDQESHLDESKAEKLLAHYDRKKFRKSKTSRTKGELTCDPNNCEDPHEKVEVPPSCRLQIQSYLQASAPE